MSVERTEAFGAGLKVQRFHQPELVRQGDIRNLHSRPFLLVDYYPRTPLASSNSFGHFLFDIANPPGDSVLVNGRFVLRNRECVTVGERGVAAKAAVQARALWGRF